jgi:F-type H+-transporting ATPase subunit delta
MTGNRAALRYATALLSQAEEKGQVQAILADMERIAETLSVSHDLRAVLRSPVVKIEDKQKVMARVFASASQETKNLLNLLANNKRVALLGQVAEAFLELQRKAQGIQAAKVISAAPLTKELEAQIIQKAKDMSGSNTIELTAEINPSIMGGFILRVGDLEYNASIANQFQKIKREFSKSI